MLKVYQRYTPDATAPTTDYPLGSIKNDSVPGADDGTPIEADWGNNIEGFHQALIADAGITADGLPDTATASQLLDAVKIVAANVVKAQMASIFMPVGTYYGNDSDPTNPSILFGFGTWVRLEGRTIMGCDDSGSGTFGIAGTQGGTTTHTHTGTVQSHVLTINEMPNHTHGMPLNGTAGQNYTTIAAGDVTSFDAILQTESAGGNAGHSHGLTVNSAISLSPYRVAYLWRRTA